MRTTDSTGAGDWSHKRRTDTGDWSHKTRRHDTGAMRTTDRLKPRTTDTGATGATNNRYRSHERQEIDTGATSKRSTDTGDWRHERQILEP